MADYFLEWFIQENISQDYDLSMSNYNTTAFIREIIIMNSNGTVDDILFNKEWWKILLQVTHSDEASSCQTKFYSIPKYIYKRWIIIMPEVALLISVLFLASPPFSCFFSLKWFSVENSSGKIFTAWMWNATFFTHYIFERPLWNSISVRFDRNESRVGFCEILDYYLQS